MVQPKAPGKGEGEAPVKLCPDCDELVHISVMTCPCCGYDFPPSENVEISAKADSMPVLSTEKPWYSVTSREFAPHPGKLDDKGNPKPDTVKVTYTVDGRKRNEWICAGHTGFAKSKADKYWRLHGGKAPFPKSADEFLERAGELMATTEVQLDFSKSTKFPEFIGHRAGEGSYSTDVAAPGTGNLGAVLGRRGAVGVGAAERERLAAVFADIEDDIPF
jgi:DNA repair protein RadD